MKLYFEGETIELEAADGVAMKVSDRVWVRTPDGNFSGVAVRSAGKLYVSYRGQAFALDLTKERARPVGLGGNEVRAPMPGLIVDLLVKVGDAVVAGQRLVVLEAMKTQQPLIAPRDGTVHQIRCVHGSQVQQGDVLVTLEPSVNI